MLVVVTVVVVVSVVVVVVDGWWRWWLVLMVVLVDVFKCLTGLGICSTRLDKTKLSPLARNSR